MPLGELGVEINRPISRREEESRKDYVRVVKKLKVEHGDDEDKENEIVGVKKVVEDEMSGRKVRCDFVTMRVEEDEICGSPKKKLRSFTNEEEKEIEEATDEEEDAENQEPVADSEVVSEAVVANFEEDEVENSAGSAGEESEEEAETPANTANSEETAVNQEFFTDSILESADVLSHSSEAETDGEVEDPDEIAPPVVSAESETDTQDSEADGASSPPTILAENVTVDELEAKASPSLRKSQEVTEQEKNAEGTPQEKESQTAPRRISDDEAAFLRDFMCRSRAGKAAKETTDSTKTMQTETSEGREEAHRNQEDDLEEQQMPSLPPTVDVDEDVTGSPLRRSKRAAVTSLPRPQIQLRRASGTEFIFQANKSASTANTAKVTRDNTKSNRGPAPVLTRLQQLVAQKAKDPQGDGSDKENDRAEDAIEAAKVVNKRKRNNEDDSARPKKVLRWNDEQLVSYKEVEPRSSQEDQTSESNEVDQQNEKAEQEKPSMCVKLTLKMSHAKEQPEEVEQSSASKKTSKSTSFAEDTKEESAQPAADSKVRRARRGIAGSVNGTPAPKRSKRLLYGELEEAAIDETLESSSQVETGTASKEAGTTLRAAATRKSRVPTLAACSTKKAAPAAVKSSEAVTKSEKQVPQVGMSKAQPATRKLRTRT